MNEKCDAHFEECEVCHITVRAPLFSVSFAIVLHHSRQSQIRDRHHQTHHRYHAAVQSLHDIDRFLSLMRRHLSLCYSKEREREVLRRRLSPSVMQHMNHRNHSIPAITQTKVTNINDRFMCVLSGERTESAFCWSFRLRFCLSAFVSDKRVK